MEVTLAGVVGLLGIESAPCEPLKKTCKSHGGHLNLEERECLSLWSRYALVTPGISD